MKSYKRVIAALLTSCLLSASLLNAEAAETGALKNTGANGSPVAAALPAAGTSKTESVKEAGSSNPVEKGEKNTEEKTSDAAQKKAAEEAAKKKSTEEAAKKKAAEEAAKKKAAEEAAKKKAAEEAAKKKAAEEAAKKKAAEEAAKKKAAEEAAKKKAAEEAAKKKAAEEAAKKKAAEEAAKNIENAKNTSLNSLSARLAKTRECVYVYKDYGLTHNRFTQRSKIYGSDKSLVKDMDENYEKDPYSGTTCIRCEQTSSKKDWGGWMFLNGYLKEWDGIPKPNDGKKGGAGLDLSGANALRFYAKGKKGGEVVEFFTCGFGYDKKNQKTVSNPDSSMRKSIGQVKLTKDWKEYVIPLNGANLSYVVCGFGYELSGQMNGKKDIVFYLDEIRFTGKIRMAQTAPVLLRSSDALDRKTINAAVTEDNALAALAFLSAGKKKEAKEILDAFVYAIKNDRAYAGESESGPRRARNAYAVGDISAFPGWNSGTRMPGWYDKDIGKWVEDQHQVGSCVGSNSYVALALLQYYNSYGDETYLETARSLMDWILKKCFDHAIGFIEGFDGWKESDTFGVYPLTKRVTKDNIIAYAAFSRLYEATGDEQYLEASENAIRFIEGMYNEWKGRFVAETTEDGFSPDPRSIVFLDIQSLSLLAMWDSFQPYLKTLSTIEDLKVKKGGYAYNRNNKSGGWWAEGTAFTALMYRMLGKKNKYEDAMSALVKIQRPNGLFPAATENDYYTGVDLSDGSSLKLSKDTHIAPSAWFIMAANGYNPFAPHGTPKPANTKAAKAPAGQP